MGLGGGGFAAVRVRTEQPLLDQFSKSEIAKFLGIW